MLATAAVLVGGLLLARAVPDDALSERILRAARRLAVPELAAEAVGAAQSQTRDRAHPSKTTPQETRRKTQHEPPAKPQRLPDARAAARRPSGTNTRSPR